MEHRSTAPSLEVLVLTHRGLLCAIPADAVTRVEERRPADATSWTPWPKLDPASEASRFVCVGGADEPLWLSASEVRVAHASRERSWRVPTLLRATSMPMEVVGIVEVDDALAWLIDPASSH